MAPPGPPSPPPLPTTLSSLLNSSNKGKASRGRATSGKSDNDFSTMSPSPNKKGVQKGDSSAGKGKELDELTRDKLLRIADDDIEQSDNFLIKTKNDRIIRIMISDYEEFEDPRLVPSDLRKLFFLNPSIAELLYEEMLEAGLVEGEPEIDESENNNEEDDEFVGGGGELDDPLELEDLEEDIPAPSSMKRQTSQERRTGGDSSSDIAGDLGGAGGGSEENDDDDDDNMEGLHHLDDNDL